MKLKKIDPPSNWKVLPRHEYSELVEFGLGIDLDDLAAHMMRNGYDESEPVVLITQDDKYRILDGRHKLEAAKKADVIPNFREFVGSELDALEFVHKKILRQHLDTGQRAMIAAKISTLNNGQKKHASGNPLAGFTQAEAAAKNNVSVDSVKQAKAVETKCTPAVQRAFRMKEVSLNDAASIASKPKNIQDKALDALRLGKFTTLKAAADKLTKPKPKPKREVLTDALGTELPDSCRDAFADPALTDMIGLLSGIDSMYDINAWTKKAGTLTTHYGFILIEKFAEHIQESQHRLQLAIEALKSGIPHAVCPKCNGVNSKSDGKTCRGCRGYGCVPEHRYQELAQ